MLLSNLSTKKNSVNSSLNFLPQPKDVNETINKYKQNCTKTRFSHQQEHSDISKRLQRNSSYNQNLKMVQCLDSFADQNITACMNHESKRATHVVLGDSESPMHYCQRCAILIASKGFNVEQVSKIMERRDNRKQDNSKRASFSQYEKMSNNGKENMNLQNLHSHLQRQPTPKIRSQHQKKLPMSQYIISELQSCWKTLKSGRQSNLNQIDMYINTLNENIDFLEDYYYVLHEYIEKQKNVQLKDILGKKQLLEQLRAQVSGFFVKGFAEIKNIKEDLMKNGEIRLDLYQQALQQTTCQKFSLNFQAAIEEVTILNAQKQSSLHKIGSEIINIVKNFHLIIPTNQSKPAKQRNSMYAEDYKPISGTKNNTKQKNIPLRQQPTSQQHHQLPPIIPGISNVESSVRSLQLSFDNSENESEASPKKTNEREESSNNFTLNNYINHQRGEESYTNLLMTSTDMN